MKNFTFTLAWLALLSISFYSQTPKPTADNPETVRVKTAKSAPAAANTLGITVEKYVVNYDVNRDGTAVQTWEMQQRVDSEIVLERFKKFERSFNGNLQTAEVLDAGIIKADGQKLPLAPDAIQIKPTPQAEAAPSFSSFKQIQIAYDDLAEGDATYFKIRLTTVKPYFEKQFDMLEVFPLGFAWKYIEVNLSAPKDFPLSVQAVDLDGGKLPDENGKARWQWRRKNLTAFEIEPGMYDFFSSSPHIAASSFKSFEEFGAAYWSEAKKKAVVTPEVQALADEITKDLIEPEKQAYAIYEWVNKNIRYLSIVLDKGGWIPHSTTEILANRYGDCKDYSTIIYALLKAKGIESYPVLIRSELGDWFPEVAVAEYFNHAILYIPSLKLFADATVPNTRLGLITQQIVGKKAILAGEQTGVIETPKDNPAANQLLSEVALEVDADGSLKAASKNIYDGRTEIIFRPLFTDSALQKNPEAFVKKLLARFGVEGSGKLVRTGNPFKVGEPFTVELEVEVPNFTTFTAKGALALPVAVNMLNSMQLEQFVKTRQRKTNLILGATRFRENFTLRLPEGVRIDALPPVVSFSNAVGSYINEFKMNGQNVSITRELVINKDVISTKDYPQIRELITRSVKGLGAEIKYSAVSLNAGAQKKPDPRKNPVGPLKANGAGDFTAGDTDDRFLTETEAARIETRLSKTPGDLENRKRLLRFYNNYDAKDTAARAANRLKHRLWILRNRPEIDDADIYGYKIPFYEIEEAEYRALKTEWLKQVAAAPLNARIRLNTVEFLRRREPEAARKVLAEGVRVDQENYEFPLLLNGLIHTEADQLDQDSPEYFRKRTEIFAEAFEAGETALALLKKERSADRDAKRVVLLQTLAKMAFELEKFDRAKTLATELILDFGQDAGNPNYTEATHIGNIVLGRVAIRENNAVKAKEYLLIAIRAPLRREKGFFSKVDMQLARELLEKGEKATVEEYLKLCEKLLNVSDMYAGKVQTIKTWQQQISQGKFPSFNFRNLK
jgi:hypothetical protein